MEIIRLYNPNDTNPYEAYIVDNIDYTACYLQIKQLLTDTVIHSGIFNNTESLLKELIYLCEKNGWVCQPMGNQKKKMFFEDFTTCKIIELLIDEHLN